MTTLPNLKPLSAAVLVAAALCAPLAQAQTQAAPVAPSAPVASHMHRGHHGLSARTLQSIGASADQQAKILAIQTQAHADLRAQHQAQAGARRQLAQALAAPTVDPAAAESARQQLVAQHDASSQRMLQARLQIAAVLTPDQRQQLLALEQQRHGPGQQRQRRGAPPTT